MRWLRKGVGWWGARFAGAVEPAVREAAAQAGLLQLRASVQGRGARLERGIRIDERGGRRPEVEREQRVAFPAALQLQLRRA